MENCYRLSLKIRKAKGKKDLKRIKANGAQLGGRFASVDNKRGEKGRVPRPKRSAQRSTVHCELRHLFSIDSRQSSSGKPLLAPERMGVTGGKVQKKE